MKARKSLSDFTPTWKRHLQSFTLTLLLSVAVFNRPLFAIGRGKSLKVSPISNWPLFAIGLDGWSCSAMDRGKSFQKFPTFNWPLFAIGLDGWSFFAMDRGKSLKVFSTSGKPLFAIGLDIRPSFWGLRIPKVFSDFRTSFPKCFSDFALVSNLIDSSNLDSS
jgi:hypothetical protein